MLKKIKAVQALGIIIIVVFVLAGARLAWPYILGSRFTQVASINSEAITAIAWSPREAKFVVSGNMAGQRGLHLYSAESARLIWSAGERNFDSLAYSPDGSLIAATAWDDQGASLRFWSTSDGFLQSTLGGNYNLFTVALSLTGTIMVGGSPATGPGPYNAYVYLLDMASKHVEQIVQQEGWLMSLSAGQDGQLIALGLAHIQSGGSSDQVVLWDANQKTTRCRLDGVVAQLSANGRILVTGQRNGAISMWQASDCSLVGTVQGISGLPMFTVTADGGLLAFASSQGSTQIEIVTTSNRQPLQSVGCASKLAGPLSFSPNGRYLLVTCFDVSDNANQGQAVLLEKRP